jgi:hypothetical protein
MNKQTKKTKNKQKMKDGVPVVGVAAEVVVPVTRIVVEPTTGRGVAQDKIRRANVGRGCGIHFTH